MDLKTCVGACEGKSFDHKLFIGIGRLNAHFRARVYVALETTSPKVNRIDGASAVLLLLTFASTKVVNLLRKAAPQIDFAELIFSSFLDQCSPNEHSSIRGPDWLCDGVIMSVQSNRHPT